MTWTYMIQTTEANCFYTRRKMIEISNEMACKRNSNYGPYGIGYWRSLKLIKYVAQI